MIECLDIERTITDDIYDKMDSLRTEFIKYKHKTKLKIDRLEEKVRWTSNDLPLH